MLHGTRISLRQIRELDLDALYDAHADIRNRGEFFPLGVQSEPAFRKTFAEGGFWQKEEGTLLIVTATARSPVTSSSSSRSDIGMRSSWRTCCTTPRSPDAATSTEAVQLLVDYLSGPRSRTGSSSSSCPRMPPRDGSQTRAGSHSREPCAVRSSTAAGIRMSCSTRSRDDPRPWQPPAQPGG